ncbi:MAG: tyrosine-type recombinase/integrase, partial [Oscillospiraceae bacterium]|nr:tyrosine-type recombinase/integrase [Oscillospiraceae bacterium]
KAIEPRAMQYRFSKILKNAGLPSVHFHALRHIFASNCIKLGFDVKALSELLGHSSVEITLNRYVHSSFEQKKEYMKRLKLAF